MTDWRVFTTSWKTNQLLADLPFSGLEFSNAVNSAGRCQIKIQMNDPRIMDLDLVKATQRGQSVMWVEYQGILVWGGLVQQRRYTRSSGWLEVTANTFSAYYSRRWQAKDYTYTWMAPADPMAIATTVINDATAIANSLLNGNGSNVGIPFEVVQFGQTPLTNWVTMSYPSIQLQTLEMIISTLTEMGYKVGFDYLDYVQWDNGVPTAQFWVANPYVGRTPQVSQLVADVEQSIDFVPSEDASKLGNSIVEMSTAAGSVMVFNQWAPAQIEYPLMQKIEMHPDINSTPNVPIVLDALAQSDLVLTAYGGDTIALTFPIRGASLEFGQFTAGDGLRLQYFGTDPSYKTTDPRFPRGLDSNWRVLHYQVNVPEKGVATMRLTLNVLPQAYPTESGLSVSGVPNA